MAINDVLPYDDENDVVDGVGVRVSDVQTNELILQNQPVLWKLFRKVENYIIVDSEARQTRSTRRTRHKFYYYNFDVKHEHKKPADRPICLAL